MDVEEPPMGAAGLRRGAQQLTRLALETLGGIMREGKSETAKLAAAREVLDRGHGKAKAAPDPEDDSDTEVVVRRFCDPQTGALIIDE